MFVLMLDLPDGALEDLQYRVELWTPRGAIECVAAIAVRPDLARAAFDAATDIWPDREITVRQGIMVLCEWKNGALVRR